jgi:SPOR domain/Tetratricopeptide repeat
MIPGLVRAGILALVLLGAQSVCVVGQTKAPSATQIDSLRRLALSVGQTRPESARVIVRRLLATLSPQDSLYPAVLLDAGRLAPDAPSVATYLQRIVVEYGRSAWADSAALLLAQLYFAQGDPAATLQATERVRRDYPDSPLQARANFWAARAYFELKDDPHGCARIQEALDGAGLDVEFKNQVAFYSTRCSGRPSVVPVVGSPRDTSPLSSPKAGAGSWTVQLLAVKSAPQVDQLLSRLKVMGFDARVVRDTTGFFKVRVGRYPTRDAAQRVQRNLKARLGGQPFVVEEP